MVEDKVNFELPDGRIVYQPNSGLGLKSVGWMKILVDEISWCQPEIRMYGKSHPVPRLCALYGDVRYPYSGLDQPALGWTDSLNFIRCAVEEWSGYRFNSVLLNYYRSGLDAMGWHADDEAVLGKNPVIVSLSLGGSRVIRFRHKHISSARFELELEQGSLLKMSGAFQHNWQHAIPRQSRIEDSRISLTFRAVNL